MPDRHTCPECGDIGWIGSEICMTCVGTGSLPIIDPIRKMIKDLFDSLADLSDKVDDVMDKCNDIFEQVSE